jgi:7,8-dihydropterin-6-yl-methyl-4-(beta-D-ribofuranosyl)aminobenzene 5'-phosphate synthase
MAERSSHEAAATPALTALEPLDSLTITTLVDNGIDVFLPSQGPARRPSLGQSRAVRVKAPFMEEGEIGGQLRAEHGFSALITLRKNGLDHRILFDMGMTPTGMVENMRVLELDPKDVEAIVFSHGHYDHTTGMDGFYQAVGRAGLPVTLHPDFWNRRRLVFESGETREMPTPSKTALRGAGFEVTEERNPSFLFERSLLVTGEVDRTSGFEPGFPPQQALKDGSWQPDPLVLDDQALVANVRDRGLVVLTGCGHAGIVNISRFARKLTGESRVYAVIGGFHLGGALFEKIIPPTIDALAAIGPQVIVPAHCTGWRAQHALAARLPEAFIPNSVGTSFVLGDA